MTSYAEMDRTRKRARAFYLELRALDLELRAPEDPEERAGYRIWVLGLTSLSERHRDRIMQRVEENKPGLLKVLTSRWDSDLAAIQREGTTP